jgi:hypothetical protein
MIPIRISWLTEIRRASRLLQPRAARKIEQAQFDRTGAVRRALVGVDDED